MYHTFAADPQTASKSCSPDSAPIPNALNIGAVVMASGCGKRFRAALSPKESILFYTPQAGPACATHAESIRAQADPPNKLLADFHGKPLLSLVLHTAASPLISVRTAVTRSPDVEQLCRSLHFPCLLHDQPLQSDTVRLGLQEVIRAAAKDGTGCLDGCIFFQGDQPLLSRASTEAMIRAFFKEPDRIFRLSSGHQAGSPVLFPQRLFPELLSLPPDCGGSFVVRRHPELVRLTEARQACELLDVDTPEALKQLLRLSEEGQNTGPGNFCRLK